MSVVWHHAVDQNVERRGRSLLDEGVDESESDGLLAKVVRLTVRPQDDVVAVSPLIREIRYASRSPRRHAQRRATEAPVGS